MNDYNNNMNSNMTYIIVKYILIFFGIVALAIGGLYLYNNFYGEKGGLTEAESQRLINDKFNNLFPKDDADKKKPEKGVDYAEQNCYLGDTVIESGAKVKLYSMQIVSPFQDCESFSKERVCDNGFMLGDNKYKYTKCRPDVDCQLPDGSILENDKSIKLYSRLKVPYGESCERYATERICKNNHLVGDERFIYKNCEVSFDNSCPVSKNKILANNQSHVFYSKNIVPFGDNCSSYTRRLMCASGLLQGGDPSVFQYWNCTEESPKDCYIGGIVMGHGDVRKLYSKEYGTKTRNCDFYDELFKCFNGELKNVDGNYTIDEYPYIKCYDN